MASKKGKAKHRVRRRRAARRAIARLNKDQCWPCEQPRERRVDFWW